MKPSNRRNFLGQLLSLGALSLTSGWHNVAFAHPSALRPAAAPDLPPRGNYLIRQAYVLTMDDALGEIPAGDVHVNDGVIVAVGRDLNAPDATVLDGRGMIVLPGLIDTHWHMWTALLRSMAGDTKGTGYFDTTRKYGPHFLPADMYQGTRLAATEALYSGITTVHDWSHNVRSLQHAEGSIQALRESGIRARYSCGAASGQDGEEMMDFTTLEHLQQNWATYAPEQLLTLGMAWRGIGGHPGIDSKARVGKQELEKVREMKLPVSVHASSPGIMAKLAEEKLLGSDIQLVHGMGASKETIAAMVAAGSSISISPYSELRIGYGFPPIPTFLDADATIGLSIDTTTLTGNADMFAVMKIFLNLANAMNEDEFSLSARQVLEFATLGGARSLGIADRTGSLTPGKRADLIMIDTRVPNMGFITNAPDLVVAAAQPSNVDTVLVDGRILKQGGRLTAVQEDKVYEEASAALAGLKERAE